ncbi:DUF4132 domain-containing protein [Streptomyces kaniharaensis]|uniref:DUF4132 domain-containing protein n=1 Tax=Streptomyces kaniharaensis TaxID=212423 RepID=A0A6N7L299_9ACTN|nr:DUF4132 domain-containing protein [Streptomyces kaniharaensis]MQS16837.1 DUF4132 domain-containing protein [Streptomyces kaniharaensis]
METGAGGYHVALGEDGRVVCRDAAGQQLESVPPQLGDDPVVARLRQLAEWLGAHERRCQEDVERWMERSLPVPTATITGVWADEAWRRVLRDLVVTGADGTAAGFLRGADPERGLALVGLDGDTVHLTDGEIRIPHPVLLADLDELRELAVELGVSQRVQQLCREVWHHPADTPDGTELTTYAGGRYEELRELLGRCARLGYQVRDGHAVLPVVEGGRTVEARLWVGDVQEWDECETGALSWTGPDGRMLPLARVGPVAWSEGMRMAAALYAGRTVEGEEAA